MMTDIPAKPRSGLALFGIVFAAMLLALVIVVIGIKWIYFPSSFHPVSLSDKEQIRLEEKLQHIGIQAELSSAAVPLEPEAYSEVNRSRKVSFTEKEINAYIASKNPELATRLVIDLSKQLASAKLLVPLAPDFPIMGGETLRINTGVEIAFRDSRPVIRLKGVSLWGVPLPNAWLGDLKNIDLVQHYNDQQGFWQSFSEGIAFIEVQDGELVVELAE